VYGLRGVTVILTATCNLRCTYCFQDRKQPQRMRWETLRAAVDLLLGSRWDDLALWFGGGEPLLEFPNVRRAVEYAESACPARRSLHFGLSTNGLLLGDGCADFLAAHRVSTQISFDGLPAAQDRRAPGSFGPLDARLRHLRRRHPRWFAEELEVAITVTGGNVAVLAGGVAAAGLAGSTSGILSATICPNS